MRARLLRGAGLIGQEKMRSRLSSGAATASGRHLLVIGLLIGLASAAPVPGTSSCTSLLQAAGQGLEKIHGINTGIANTCADFQSDVYQRFSAFIMKQRVASLCQEILALHDGFLRLILATSPAPPLAMGPTSGMANGDDCKDVVREEVMASLTMATSQAIGSLIQGFAQVVQDFNAGGDGSLQQVVSEHLESISGNLMAVMDRFLTGSIGYSVLVTEAIPSFAGTIQQLVRAVFEQLGESVTYNIQAFRVQSLSKVLGNLDSFPAATPVVVTRGGPAHVRDGVCRDLASKYSVQHIYDPVAEPDGWTLRDVAGILQMERPSVHKLFFTISKSVPLSYNVVAILPRVQSGLQELTSEYKKMFHSTGGFAAAGSDLLSKAGITAEPNCNGTGLAYSPAHCLFDRGWGSMIFSLGTEPPFDGVLAVAELSLRGVGRRPSPFVQPVANESDGLEALLDYADSVYKSLNTPSPDMFFLSPMVGNCLTFRKLGPSRSRQTPINGASAGSALPQLTPKLIWVPINPLIPPPWELAPDFSQWHRKWMENWAGDTPPIGRSGYRAEAEWWLAQCSLATAVKVMAEQGYVLLHVEVSFAVFVFQNLHSSLDSMLKDKGPTATTPYEQWLSGWHCSPTAASFQGLEWAAGEDLTVLHSGAKSAEEQRAAWCRLLDRFSLPLALDSMVDHCGQGSLERQDPGEALLSRSWHSWDLANMLEERGKKYILETEHRGRCLSNLGICECFPPYRGRYCESTDAGQFDGQRPYRAALHYLVGDREKLLTDMEKTLPLLWARFNSRFDYPVVVFHDGLSHKSRQRILGASKNRIWFALVEDYLDVPAYLNGRLELDLGGYGLGYRGMCKFRSGPMFLQPVLKNMDYAWTLDTDGYFPADILDDPFQRMHDGGYIYAYSHISRDQASAVQHFWEFCRLYFEHRKIDPKSTKMMRRMTDALVLRDTYWHEWNRVLFMNDIEITRLDWFRGEQYQDFYRFLDSVGGFWLYRWGDHAVRTIAIALWLDPARLLSMGVPYGHQNTCRCGKDRPDEVCVRESPSDWWRCLPREEARRFMPPGSEEATGDIGTVKEDLIFGGE